MPDFHPIGAALLADSSIPTVKLIWALIVFGPIAVFATRCSFASRETLRSPRVAQTIGTDNPNVARAVCVIVALLLWTFVVVAIANLTGAGF